MKIRPVATLLQLVGEAQVVHDQPTRLVLEHAVDPRDSLHEPVPAHRLVHVHRVQARCIETREPHVAHDDELERVLWIPKAIGQRLAPGLVADVGLPVGWIRSRAGHHYLERAALVLGAIPVGPQLHDLAVQIHADAPTHAHDHRLAVQGVGPFLEVLDDVARDQPKALLGADHGLELRPLGLELLLALDLLAFGRLLELGVDLRPLCLVERELGQPALVVDRHRGAVLHGALNVVDADVVAEHGARIGVRELDRRAGEADERRVRQRVAHVARKAVDEVILAAVRLVGDHHDVTALREGRVPVALLLWEELVNGGEHHPSRRHAEQLAQVRAALRLHRRLAQQVLATREGAEELIVEVVAVGKHDESRVLHRRLTDDAAGVERHRQALTRALRVPNHAHAPVTGLASRLATRLVASLALGHSIGRAAQLRGAQRLTHRHLNCVELVVACHLLGDAAAVVLEHDEVAQQVEEAPRRAQSLDHHLELRQVRVGQRLARDGPPGLEPLAPGGERAYARLHPVGDGEQRVRCEQRRHLRLVGLELLEGAPDRGVLVGGVLELHHRQRQAVHAQHQIGPPRVLVLDDAELVHRQPVVARRVVEVDHPRLGAADVALGIAVLDRHAIDQQAVQGAVAHDELRALGPRQLAEGVVQRLGGQLRVKPRQRVAQALGQDDLGVVVALGRGFAGGDLGTASYLPASAFEPCQRGLFDDGFSEGLRAHGLARLGCRFAQILSALSFPSAALISSRAF